jgi:hypothetical protein
MCHPAAWRSRKLHISHTNRRRGGVKSFPLRRVLTCEEHSRFFEGETYA